jgi:hypothetical protein
MTHFRPRRLVAVAAAAIVALSATLVAPAAASNPHRTRAQGTAKCPVGAAKKASDKPVEITFWHAMADVRETLLQQLTDEFNGSQDDVRVTLVNQVSYESLFDNASLMRPLVRITVGPMLVEQGEFFGVVPVIFADELSAGIDETKSVGVTLFADFT